MEPKKQQIQICVVNVSHFNERRDYVRGEQLRLAGKSLRALCDRAVAFVPEAVRAEFVKKLGPLVERPVGVDEYIGTDIDVERLPTSNASASFFVCDEVPS